MDWPGHKRQRSTLRLYRNNRNGTFTDVTRARRARRRAVRHGRRRRRLRTTTASPTSCITCVGQNRLFRNTGKGTFVDVTEGERARRPARRSAPRRCGSTSTATACSTSSSATTSSGRPSTTSSAALDGKQKSYCTPEAYRGDTCWLFRNRGNGTFEDVTATSGIFDSSSKSLGVAMLDDDQDGWPDLFVANDTQPNKLYRNQRNGTFKEVGAARPASRFSDDGKARARAWASTPATSTTRAARASRSPTSTTRWSGSTARSGRASSRTSRCAAGVGAASRNRLGFGCVFADLDLDGALDLVVVNGHIDDTVRNIRGRRRLRAAAAPLPATRAAARSRTSPPRPAPTFARPRVGRGLAYGDFDRDGDVDLLITTNNGPAVLFRNDQLAGNRSLRFRLVGTKSNRDAIGAARPDLPRRRHRSRGW